MWKGREKDAEEQKGGDFFRHPPSAFHRRRKGRKVEEDEDLTHFVSFLSGLGKVEKERKLGRLDRECAICGVGSREERPSDILHLPVTVVYCAGERRRKRVPFFGGAKCMFPGGFLGGRKLSALQR